MAFCVTAAASAVDEREYTVKAAYILNFIHLTEWPSGAFAHPSSPLKVCLLGKDVFAGALDLTLKGEAVAGHPLQVDRLDAASSIRSCHLAFVSRGATPEALPQLRRLGPAPVLTIGESDQFAAARGIITFDAEGERIRFDVNRSVAVERNLELSSRLLRLARHVR